MKKIHKTKRTETLSRYKGPIKIGDTVMMLSGDEKKATGRVIDFHRKKGLIKVENIMMRTHFIKAKDNDGKGGTEKKESWIPVCKVKLVENNDVK